MRPQDMWRGLQIRDGAGQLENAVKAPRRKAQPVRRVGKRTSRARFGNGLPKPSRPAAILKKSLTVETVP